jgi:hypothetical protein
VEVDVAGAGAGSAAFETETDVADESGDPGTVITVVTGVPVVRMSV